MGEGIEFILLIKRTPRQNEGIKIFLKVRREVEYIVVNRVYHPKYVAVGTIHK